MNQSQILIAEMSDADGIQVCVKTRAEHGLGQTKRIFFAAVRDDRKLVRSFFKAPSVAYIRDC